MTLTSTSSLETQKHSDQRQRVKCVPCSSVGLVCRRFMSPLAQSRHQFVIPLPQIAFDFGDRSSNVDFARESQCCSFHVQVSGYTELCPVLALLNRTCQGVDKHHAFLEGYSCLWRLSEDVGGSQEAKTQVSKVCYGPWLGPNCSVQGGFASPAWRSMKSCSHIRALSPLLLLLQSTAEMWDLG